MGSCCAADGAGPTGTGWDGSRLPDAAGGRAPCRCRVSTVGVHSPPSTVHSPVHSRSRLPPHALFLIMLGASPLPLPLPLPHNCYRHAQRFPRPRPRPCTPPVPVPVSIPTPASASSSAPAPGPNLLQYTVPTSLAFFITLPRSSYFLPPASRSSPINSAFGCATATLPGPVQPPPDAPACSDAVVVKPALILCQVRQPQNPYPPLSSPSTYIYIAQSMPANLDLQPLALAHLAAHHPLTPSPDLNSSPSMNRPFVLQRALRRRVTRPSPDVH